MAPIKLNCFLENIRVYARGYTCWSIYSKYSYNCNEVSDIFFNKIEPQTTELSILKKLKPWVK